MIGRRLSPLDNAVFVLGPDGSRAYLNTLPGTEAFVGLRPTASGFGLAHNALAVHAATFAESAT